MRIKKKNKSISGRKTDLVYIMAPSYTGSTLLTYLLAMHPDIATIGELKASAMGDIESYTCSCGSLIRQCGFWRNVLKETHKQGISFSLDKFGTHFRGDKYVCDRLIRAGVKGSFWEAIRKVGFTLLSPCRRKCNDIVLQNRNLIEVICNLQGADVFLDGSKDPNRVRYFYNSGYWNIKVIYLIRDGRGATNSYMRHHKVTMEIAAREWVHVHRECDRIQKMLGPFCRTIHYEELCQNPDDVLRRIFSFIGLDTDSITTDFKSVEHHILGNAMRMASTSAIQLDEKWKSSLTENDLQSFVGIAGHLNSSYGYE